MAKASKLTKVNSYLTEKGADVCAQGYELSAVIGGIYVYVEQKASTVEVSIRDAKSMNQIYSYECKTQAGLIQAMSVFVESAIYMAGCESATTEAEAEVDSIDEAIEALDAVEVVRTEGSMLFDTIKKAFPHLQVANQFTTIISERPEMINYNFDVIKALGHSVIIRVYRDKISLISYNNGDTNILYFEPKQHDDVIQALEAHFPNQLTAEALEAEGLQVVEDIQEAIYITPEGVLIGGEFDCGTRGVDHRIISYLVPVKPYEDHTAFWNYVHENLGLVRLVPETGIALIGQKQVLTDVQIDKLMRTNYVIEQY